MAQLVEEVGDGRTGWRAIFNGAFSDVCLPVVVVVVVRVVVVAVVLLMVVFKQTF